MSNTKTVMGQASNQYVTPLDITDVFSTYLYTGNGSTQTVTNGIDLAGEGGMVWAKSRNNTYKHSLYDTERGTTKNLSTDSTAVEVVETGVTSFNSSGFNIGSWAGINLSGDEVASWTFRKAPKFFDCVTYSGTGVIRTVNHSLGSVPGMVIVKRTDTTGSWRVYHRGSNATAPENYYLTLDATDQAGTGGGVVWNDTAPTDSVFTVGANNSVNASGGTYVAYVFAHNDGDGGFGPDGSDIIKCGSYTTDGNEEATIDLGWEPQWVLFKRTDSSTGGDWNLFDTMRGLTADTSGNGAKLLEPNTSDAELATSRIAVTPTGFKVDNYGASRDYIYMAIRRGPLAQPESGTEVFHTQSQSNGDTYSVGFPTDLALINKRSGSSINTLTTSRLTGNDQYLVTSGTNVEATSSNIVTFDLQNSFDQGFSTASPWVGYHWKRAPGYFDSVSWKVDGTGDQTIKHNLGVVPEMVWSKNRNTTSGTYNWWVVAHKDLTGWDSANENDRHVLRLDSSAASAQQGYHRDFTDTSIRMLSVASGGYTTTDNVIAYLFGTVAGVSKVGSYTGTGATLNIDCGFTSGARFVLLKKTSSTGHWILFDTARGIVSGNDPFLQINRTTAEVTAYDVVDPYSSGFTLTSDPTYGLNTSGDSYIFYAIA
jgi:hypothetical protein